MRFLHLILLFLYAFCFLVAKLLYFSHINL